MTVYGVNVLLWLHTACKRAHRLIDKVNVNCNDNRIYYSSNDKENECSNGNDQKHVWVISLLRKDNKPATAYWNEHETISIRTNVTNKPDKRMPFGHYRLCWPTRQCAFIPQQTGIIAAGLSHMNEKRHVNRNGSINSSAAVSPSSTFDQFTHYILWSRRSNRMLSPHNDLITLKTISDYYYLIHSTSVLQLCTMFVVVTAQLAFDGCACALSPANKKSQFSWITKRIEGDK